MAVNHGRLEGRITVPTGGWDVSLTDDGGGPTTVTIPAGTYYMLTLIAEMNTQSNATMTDTWTWSIADGEDASGKVTVTTDGSTVTVTWSDTDLRDVLGFETDGNLSASTTYTSTESARMIWIPNGPKQTPFGDGDEGVDEDDTRGVESPSGDTFGAYGNTKTILSFRWIGVSFDRTRISAESVLNQSWQKFREDAIRGSGPGATTLGPIRLYWDADDDSSYMTGYPRGQQVKQFVAESMDQHRTTSWIIPFELVKVPS